MSSSCPNILKKSFAWALVFAFGLTAQAQNPSAVEGHGIVLLKQSWNSYRPGWDRRTVGGMGPVRDSSGQINPPILSRGDPLSRIGYRYKVKVSNRGQREARAIVWEYRVIEKITRQTTAHRFRSRLKLNPGASAELKEFSYAQPSNTISTNSAGKNYKAAFDEEVVIVRVEYADGST